MSGQVTSGVSERGSVLGAQKRWGKKGGLKQIISLSKIYECCCSLMFVQICCGLFSKDKVRVIVKSAVRGNESVRGESKSHRKLGEPPIRLLSGENILDSILHHVAKRIRLFQIFRQSGKW